MRKRIMFVVPKLTGGGAEKTVANLSKSLNHDKYDISIVVMQDTEKKYDYAGELIVLKSKRKSGLLKIIYTLSLVRELKKIKKERKIDIAISFLTYADIINILSRTSEKTIISIRNMDSMLLGNKVLFNIEKYCCKKADLIVAISKKVQDDVFVNFGVNKNKTITIYNPCVISKSEENFVTDDDFIVCVGRLTYQKGQWHIIKAFSEIEKVFPNLKLYILGEGEYKDKLFDLVSLLQLEGKVIFSGFVDRPLDYVRNSKAFVFPSMYEGLGNSLLEAISCGTPIVSSDCDAGPREILAPDTDYRYRIKDNIEFAQYGVLVPVDNSHELSSCYLTNNEKLMAKAVIELLKNNDLQQKYKLLSKKRANDFSKKIICEEWEKIL